MADPIVLYSVCGKCHGDGQFPNVAFDFEGNESNPESTVECPDCGGTGRIARHFIDSSIRELLDDTLDKVSDVLDKCNDIFEKLDE